jgi:hypothetical protein
VLYPLKSLKPDVARRIDLFQRDVVTLTETAAFLLERFAFAIQDFPDGHREIADLLNFIPTPLITAMMEGLIACRNLDGLWRWPPAGPGLPTPGPASPWGTAKPDESRVLDILAAWVGDRIREVSA